MSKKNRPCAKCGKPFIPTKERKLTCENCYRANSNIPPMAEEPNLNKNKKAATLDDSLFKRIYFNPLRTPK